MERIKDLYNKISKSESRTVKNTAIISFILGVFLITSAVYIFWNSRRARVHLINSTKKFPQKIINHRPIPIHKSPQNRGRFLIRKKPGYVEQSPERKTYPSKFKISSILD